MKSTLLVISRYHYRLYCKGIEYYNKIHTDEKVDAFIIEKPVVGFAGKIKNFFQGKGSAEAVYFRQQIELLKKRIEDYDKILFFNLNFYEYDLVDKDLFELLEAKYTKLLFLDSMKKFSIDDHILTSFDKVFSFDTKELEYIREKWHLNSQHVPLGTNYNLYPVQDAKENYDVCFVGISNPKRLKYLDAIAEYCDKNNKKLFVSGHYWHDSNKLQSFLGERSFKRKHPVLFKYLHNQFIEPKDLASVYNQTKICLNINVDYHNNFNSRNFDVLYMGKLLISDTQDLSGIVLEPGKHFLMCDDEAGMVKLIDKYLQAEDERERIAKSGKKIIEEKYLFVNSLHEIVSD